MRIPAYVLPVILATLGAITLTTPARAQAPDPAAWVVDAELIATEFAITQGWTADACPRVSFSVVDSLVDGEGGRLGGRALLSECRMEIDSAQATTPWAFCRVYVHERLHLWRGDGWHSHDQTHPLSSGWFAPCVEIDPTFGRGPEKICVPGWVAHSPQRIRRTWQTVGRERIARHMFRRWAKHHPTAARRASFHARHCSYR